MNKQDLVPIEGNRFLDEKTIQSILAMSVDGESNRPICPQLATTHAAGAAVAGLVARAMAANISFLYNQVDVCCGEVASERDFTDEKLQEHTDILMGLNLLLFQVTAERRLGYSEEEQNLLTRAFATLPQEVLSDINEDVIRIRQILEGDVLSEMMELIGKIWEDPEKNWTEEIKSLMQETIPGKLLDIMNRLDQVKKNMDSIMSRINMDWNKDLKQIAASKLCGQKGANK